MHPTSPEALTPCGRAERRPRRSTPRTALLRAASAVALTAGSLLLASCVGLETEEAPQPGAWHRQDLWLASPRVEMASPEPPQHRFWHRRLEPRGTLEVRDMSRLNAWERTAVPRQTAAEIRVLRQRPGTRLAWKVELGGEAFLTVVPLGTEPGSDRGATLRLGLRTAQGEIRELFHEDLPPLADPAPPTLEIDLSAWSHQPVEILLQVDPPPGAAPFPFALWGSPQVWSRGPNEDPAQPRGARESDRPNILLLGVDTLRADALGAYGRSPTASPTLDRLAAESDVWLDAFSTFNNTNPSFTSIHTGLYGKNHRIYDLVTPLAPEHTTLAESLSAAGYQTLAIIAAHHLANRTSGLGQGFDEVVSPERGPFAAELVVDAAIDWLTDAQEPFFAWLHLFDPHTPHTPPQPFAIGLRGGEESGLHEPRSWRSFRPLGPRTYIEHLYAGHADLYAGEVAYLDRQIDRLLAFLKSRDLLSSTLIVFVADHGESFGEHGLYASHVGLWDTSTHVPLMIRWPGEHPQGRRLQGLVQTLDLFPTLLRAAGLEPPLSDGLDLLELTGDDATGRQVVMSEHANLHGVSARTARWRYVSISGQVGVADGEHLYDLAADPGETRDVAAEHPAQLRRLAELTRRWREDTRPVGEAPQPEELSPEEVERLRALGYLR